MQITFYGHNSFLFKSDINILVDPFISSNPKAQHILMENIKVDYVLITHGHADHLADLDKIMIHNDAKIITMVEVASWLAKNGHNRSHSLNFGGIYEFSKKTSVKYVQAVHSSSMPDGSYGGHPGSFILKTDDKTIFIAGDTALHSDLKLFGTLNDIDLAILPIGGNYTMDTEDAVHAAKFLDCNQIIGCHFDSFPEIKIDHKSAINLFESHQLNLKLMKVDDSITL